MKFVIDGFEFGGALAARIDEFGEYHSPNIAFTQYTFGAGNLYAKRTDVTGQQVSFFATVQDWSVDLDQKLVSLIGQNKFPVDIAPSEASIKGKIKQARVQSFMINNTLLGQTVTSASGFDVAVNENHSSLTTTTFAVTNGATFLEDLGIIYHGTGIAFLPTTATPSAGYYIPGTAGNSGVYTIAVADETVAGGIDVSYTYSVTTMFQTSIAQTLMGTGPQFELIGKVPYTVQGVAKTFNMKWNAARATKITFAFKNVAYMIPEFDYEAFADASGNVGTFSITE